VKQTKYQAVIFDCDSTLSTIEGVDELADRKGVGKEIAGLTEAAMQGRIPLEQIYAERLARIRPTADDLAWLGRRYVDNPVTDAGETIAQLQAVGSAVYVVSGGFLQAVQQLASALAVPSTNVYAVEIALDPGGCYAGYDESSPLTRSGGKVEIVQQLLQRYDTLIAVGDGITDLEMQRAGIRVIGFGGVCVRDAVKQQADYYIEDASIKGVLDIVLNG